MALTTKQREELYDIQQELEARKMVMLTGPSNGKTYVHHRIQEVIGKRDERTGRIGTTPRHKENNTVEFLDKVIIPYRMSSMATLMRQVIAWYGRKTTYDFYNTSLRFEGTLLEAKERGQIICLAIDNAELLGPTGYTVLKALNEYRSTEKHEDIGVSVLLSFHGVPKKVPLAFLRRCSEHRIGKIMVDEVAELIESAYPNTIGLWDQQSLIKLAKAENTLHARATIEKCMNKRRELGYRTIEPTLVERNLALAA